MAQNCILLQLLNSSAFTSENEHLTIHRARGVTCYVFFHNPLQIAKTRKSRSNFGFGLFAKLLGKHM